MTILRAIGLLLVFFAGLYILRDPIQHTGPNLNVYIVEPLKEFFTDITSATTSLPDYAPLPSVSTSTATLPKVVPFINANSTFSTSDSASNITDTVLSSPSKKEMAALPPVKAKSTETGSHLTISGIISFSNKERIAVGLPALRENPKLAASAQSKLDDMFNNQYFEHVSPTGLSVSDLADKAEYSYIVIGENLALGNFGSNENVVEAWMNSPGHKANILNQRYQEIGVAVAQRMYQGRQQWIAVQHFGTPLSACPAPRSQDKSVIDALEKELIQREADLETKKKIVDTLSGSEYENAVRTYNDLIEVYNGLLATLKAKIAVYNESVKNFNSCLGV